MKRRTAFLFCALLAVASCAKPLEPRPPAPPPPPAPAASAQPEPAAAPPEPESPPAEQPKEETPPPAPKLSLEAPDGWLSIPRGRLQDGTEAVYVNPSLKSVVAVTVESSEKSAAADAQAFSKKLLSTDGNEHVKMGKPVVSKDGKTASMTITGDGRVGMLTVRHLGPDGHLSASFLGAWPKENAKLARPVYDHVVKTAKLP